MQGGTQGTFLPSFPLQVALRADNYAMRTLSLIARPCFGPVVLDAWDMGLPISAFSSQELTSEGHGVVMHYKHLSHFWNIPKLHL